VAHPCPLTRFMAGNGFNMGRHYWLIVYHISREKVVK